MPGQRGAKASRKARAQAALRHQLTADELFADLTAAYTRAKGQKKVDLGLQLIPFLKPKLRSVEVAQTTDVNVKITIGGDDADDNG